LEEEMNALEEVDQCIVTRYNILHDLRTERHMDARQWTRKQTHPEKNADAGKDRFGG
jgi:hypothetical protein